VTYATSLGFDSLAGPLIAQDLSASPTDPSTVAVSRLAGVVILYHGTLLPNISNSPFNSINSIAFGSSGTDLYGYNNANTGFDFYRMSVNSSGVSLVDKYERLFYGFYADIQNHNGLIYSSNGTVINPAVPACGVCTQAQMLLHQRSSMIRPRKLIFSSTIRQKCRPIRFYATTSATILSWTQRPCPGRLPRAGI